MEYPNYDVDLVISMDERALAHYTGAASQTPIASVGAPYGVASVGAPYGVAWSAPSRSIDVEQWVQRIHEGLIPFPYRRYGMEDPRILLEQLRQVTITETTIDTFSYEAPINFEGPFSVYATADTSLKHFADYFSEPIRVRSKPINAMVSLYDLWMTKTREILYACLTHYDVVSPVSLSQCLYQIAERNVPIIEMGKRQATTIRHQYIATPIHRFPLVPAIAVIQQHCPIGGTVLDTSPRWGDRLIATLASHAGSYLGTESNLSLFSAYREIHETLNADRSKMIQILPIGSEHLPREHPNTVDLIFTSPPYFNFETYAASSSQPKATIPFEQWVDQFLKPTMERAWYRLKPNGYAVVMIRDVRVPIVEHLFQIMDDLGAEPLVPVLMGKSVPIKEETLVPLWRWQKPA